MAGNWLLETGYWKLAAGNWRLETGGWLLIVASCLLSFSRGVPGGRMPAFGVTMSDFGERRLQSVARGREGMVTPVCRVRAAVALLFDVRDLAMSGHFPIAPRHASA